MAVILQELGFKVFTLRESRNEDEVLIYGIKNKLYNSYSKKRAINFLFLELEAKNINIIDLLHGQEKEYNEEDFEKIKAYKLKLINRVFDKEVILIDNEGYKPCEELVFEEDAKKYFNRYKKSKILENFKPNDNTFENIHKLIFNIVGNKEEHYIYFNKWLAWILKNPLDRLPTSIILQGEHGTGKTKFCELILEKIFGKNFLEINQSEINSDYNEYIFGKQLIVANEVIHNDNKYLVPDKLKTFITDVHLSINKRFKDTFSIINYSQWIFTSNNQVPLKVDPGDRRYTIFKSKKLVNGEELIGNLQKNLEKELQGYLNYLFNLEVEFIEVAKPLQNQEKQDLIEASYNSVDDFYYLAKDTGGFDALNKLYASEDSNYFNYIEIYETAKGYAVISSNLYNLYKNFCSDAGYKPFGRANFIRELRRFNLSPSVQKVAEKTQRVLLL